MNNVIQIREAQRQGARLVIGLQGISGSGKTYTALQIAHGLAGMNAAKVGFLDTENRRGSLYADSLKKPDGSVDRFLIGDLPPPFSPQRYIDAIAQFEAAGVEVLVIDSVSHEWAGQGGCYDIAKNTTNKIDNWLLAKAQHKRFMSAMLQSSMHIIACIREAPKTDFKDPKAPKSLGLMPIQESQFVFELTASLQMWGEGKQQAVLKCPAELRPYLGRQQGYITPQDGAALRAWVNGAAVKTPPTVLQWRDRVLAICERGEAAVTEAWGKIPQAVRDELGADFHATLIASAREFDAQRQAAHGADDAVNALNNQIASPMTGGKNQQEGGPHGR